LSATTPLDRGRLRSRLAQGEFTVGTFIGLGTPTSAEIAAASGVDWVLLDLEHGGGGEDQVGQSAVATGGYGVPTLVRVETAARIRIGRALDAGAAGVMMPRLDTIEEIHEAVRHLRYPPLGDRGVATYNRAARWGGDTEAIARSATEVLGIVQIESARALEAVDEIAAIDGVDVLFIGPLDLSFDLGVPRDFASAIFREATEAVVNAAEKHGKAAGILAVNRSAAKDYRNRGFRFMAVGSDSTLLSAAVAAAVADIYGGH
jgi:2-dehydro-3-deoxyglucarate aldolase/4-hydroxy-2-oxoheptanedioate aldolase